MSIIGLRDERQFQAAVGRLAVHHDVLHYHTYDSRRSDSGFPDCTLVGREVMFRELKMTRRSRIRVDQQVWIDRLRAAGADVAVWYAEDYHCGRVDEQLRDLAVRRGGRGGRRDTPPLSMRLAKRLYVKSAGPEHAKASLLWEAGVASVHHGDWIARAHEVLAIVVAELPHTDEQHLDWLSRHQLGAAAGAGAIFAALKSDLTAPADAGPLLAGLGGGC